MVARLSGDGSRATLVAFYHQQDLQPGVYHLLVQLDGKAEYKDIQPVETNWRLMVNGLANGIELEKLGDAQA